LTVFDRPSLPRGPIEFSNITADSLNLSWIAPEHDGGAQVNNYIVMKRERETDVWTEVAGMVARTSLKVNQLFYEFLIYVLFCYLINGRRELLSEENSGWKWLN